MLSSIWTLMARQSFARTARAAALAGLTVIAGSLAGLTGLGLAVVVTAEPAAAQSNGGTYEPPYRRNDPYSPDSRYGRDGEPREAAPAPRADTYAPRADTYAPRSDSYAPPVSRGAARADDAYRPPAPSGGYAAGRNDAYRPPGQGDAYAAGRPYEPGPGYHRGGEAPAYGEARPRPDFGSERHTYSQNEVVDAGHHFFGSVSRGLARAVERLFRSQGRPNGYILGEDASGAFVAGLRYGEGRLFTKFTGSHRVYWQGPSIGYDFGGEGTKTMVLVYNLRDPSDIYRRFGGVQGSAFVIGGVGVQLQKHGDVVLALIRSGVGFRLGANVGYLKYTPRPTWNPF